MPDIHGIHVMNTTNAKLNNRKYSTENTTGVTSATSPRGNMFSAI